MSWKKWSRFSPRVALLLAVATAVPLAALLWVGWRALEQDRALENEQIRQQVERAADIVAAALQRAVAASERRLAQGSKDWPDGAAAMTVSGETVQVWPMGRAAYLPVAPRLTELSGAPFAAGEAVEFRQRDLNGAAAIYRDLAGSNRRDVRVGALLRLARCLRASGKQAEALPFYARLSDEDGLAFEGAPVSLVARQARCSLMEALKQAEDLRREAAALGSDLQQGRWPLTRALAQLYAQDAERWGGSRPCPASRSASCWQTGCQRCGRDSLSQDPPAPAANPLI